MKIITTSLKVIWFLACLAGNIYQITEISSDYLAYQIVTTINVNFPYSLQAPSMGVCFFENQIADLDVLESVNPSFREELNISSLTNEEIIDEIKRQGLAEKRKFQGIMFKGLDLKTRSQVTYNFTDLFSRCLLVKPDGARQVLGNCSSLFNIVFFHFLYYNCYSFNLKTDLTLEFLRSNRAETIMGFLYYFMFTPLAVNVTSEALFFYNTNNDYNRMGYFRYLFLSELGNLISLSYEEFSNSLLPSPYVTHCINYTSDVRMQEYQITDRGSCYEACLKYKSGKVIGPKTLLPGIFVFEDRFENDTETEILDVFQLYSNETLIDMKDSLSAECDKLCVSPACQETFRVPTLRSSIEYAFACCLTYLLQSPKIETTCEAKLSFVVFLTNIFSTFGFWVGLSLYSIIDIFADFIGGIYNRFNRTENGKKGRNEEKVRSGKKGRNEKRGNGQEERMKTGPKLTNHEISIPKDDILRYQQGFVKKRRPTANSIISLSSLYHHCDRAICTRCTIIGNAYDKHLVSRNPPERMIE